MSLLVHILLECGRRSKLQINVDLNGLIEPHGGKISMLNMFCHLIIFYYEARLLYFIFLEYSEVEVTN